MNRSIRFTARRALPVVIGLVAALCAAPGLPAAIADGASASYVVLYREGASTAQAQGTIAAAGGTIVANYSQIGVVIARSDRAGFAAALRGNGNVEGVASTSRFATRVADTGSGGAAPAINPAAWGDSLSGQQWDMRQIHVPEAHAINQGSRSVLAASIDTGLDFTHPDLAPNYDASNSADCTSGAAQPLAVGNDLSGHGTHVSGTIAAAANGTGVVGVAPNVRLAGIRAGNADGFFFPEAVVCAFMWAGTHGVDVTSNSYFADPWLFNCRNDAEQRAIWKAERRAIRFAQSNGVLVIASEGNESTDLSHPRVDVISPDFPPGSEVEREVTNACAVVPVEVPGVVGVTATGNLRLKSFYSSYGISTADVAAPGGDSILQVTAAAPNGRVLSTFSSVGTICPPARTVVENGAKYCYLQGTSMAGPHATGVAALILSSHANLTAGALAARLQRDTNPLPCPDTSIYDPFPQSDGSPQSCQGGTAHNSFYGAGEVDALKAVG
ncbi:MAG TPA: S8 family serine peptidase [Actinophytocola sp.]|uniref:S8 family peptidase n=1 Tax=Actinophytocola sp. TaxID=1872138 RepID=UPI002DDDA726|nr:S8 family serine peptidase [Actinophytocola sp.]HEV2778991.1 S8 family serine peptidase [Actinophytocola sp.]